MSPAREVAYRRLFNWIEKVECFPSLSKNKKAIKWKMEEKEVHWEYRVLAFRPLGNSW